MKCHNNQTCKCVFRLEVTFWLTWTELCFLSHPTRLTWLRQTFSYIPNWNHESVVMHELAHCHDGGTRSCFSTTEVFFSWHFLLDVSTLWDNTSDSLLSPDVRIHDAQHPRCQKKTINMTFTLMNISHLEYHKTHSARTWTNSSRVMTDHSRMTWQKGW
jgi:hypothetical protein